MNIKWLTNIGVGKKISGGFGILALIMVLTVVIATNRITSSQEINNRVFELRTPTVLASNHMLNGINHSLAALRGYMILGADKFKQGRIKAWEQIDGSYAKMEKFSKNWTNPDNVRRLQEMGAVLDEFKQAQQEIEDISGTLENTPATKILVKEAAPRAGVMVTEITNIINMEAKEAATKERKALLGMMADVRGTTGLALANIRAFLLTGDEKFHTQFEKFWSKNVKRYADLKANAHLLTAKQKVSFNKFSTARSEFKDLPPKMFEIRGGKQWNLANYWLGSKAAPRAGKLTTALSAMVENQTKLANDDIALAEKTGHELKNFMLVLGVVSVLIALVVAFFVVRMITKPVAQAAAGLKEIANGDLSRRWEVTSNDELGNMLGDMNSMADSLSSIVSKVRTSTNSITTAAGEISEGNISLSQRTEEQASSLEETASSMEEMTSTVKQNADNAGQANQLAMNARSQAEEGGAVVSDAVKAMAEINKSSSKIADIISVVEEIAFQTNLLALNAAVEAARAGEQGRGFAVVATEVRTLAQRSSESAKEIKDLIEDSVDKVKSGTELVDKSGQTLEEIVTSVKKVTDIVSEIAASSSEQASGIEQVNKAVMQMDEMTQQNAALVEESASASKSMEDQAENLNEEIAFFKIDSTGAVAKKSMAVEQAPVAERRGPERPFQEKVAQAAGTSEQEISASATPVRKKTGTHDDEWSEF